MSGEQQRAMEGWTVPLKQHVEALAAKDWIILAERDRRYAEVNVEREKALKIKEEADKVALDLARQIQTYKDEKANELREQINSERGLYVTRQELKPISDFVTSLEGRREGIGLSAGVLVGALSAFGVIVGIIVSITVLVAR